MWSKIAPTPASSQSGNNRRKQCSPNETPMGCTCPQHPLARVHYGNKKSDDRLSQPLVICTTTLPPILQLHSSIEGSHTSPHASTFGNPDACQPRSRCKCIYMPQGHPGLSQHGVTTETHPSNGRKLCQTSKQLAHSINWNETNYIYQCFTKETNHVRSHPTLQLLKRTRNLKQQ